MKNENYIVIQGWMVNELGLKPVEQLVFATIYGFCQDKESKYCGGLKYLVEGCNVAKETIRTTLSNLVTKQLIVRQEVFTSGVKFVHYTINWDSIPNFSTGYTKNWYGGIPESGTNNIIDNTNNNSITSTIVDVCHLDDKVKCDLDVEGFITYFNTTLASTPIPPIKSLGTKRKSMLNARFKEHGRAGLLKVIENISASAYLQGGGNNGWTLTIDWLLKPANFIKVLEGNYNPKATATHTTITTDTRAKEDADKKALIRQAGAEAKRKAIDSLGKPTSEFSSADWDYVTNEQNKAENRKEDELYNH